MFEREDWRSGAFVVGGEHGGLYGEEVGDDELIFEGLASFICRCVAASCLTNTSAIVNGRISYKSDSFPTHLKRELSPENTTESSGLNSILFSGDAWPAQKSNGPPFNKSEWFDELSYTFLSLRDRTGLRLFKLAYAQSFVWDCRQKS